jgi:large subunit ribosomal protein L3
MIASLSRQFLARAVISPRLSTRLATPSAVRCFQATSVRFHDDKTTDDPSPATTTTIETINNTSSLSDDDLAKILQEELAELDREESAKYVANWKPGMRKRPVQMSYNLEDFEYELHGKQRPWTLRDKRCGALAIKVGMMPVFDSWGVRHPCTVLFLDSNIVLGHCTTEKNGYSAIRVAAGQRKRKNVGKSVLGQYREILEGDEENPPYLVREFLVSDEAHLLPVGSQIHARHFCPGQNIDASAIAKGKGFQGAMKRHGFAGLPASHGVSKAHRALGSTGQCQDPGKVFKGKKMAGRMGGKRITTQNLRIVKIDRGRNLIYVLGSVPGNNGNFVEIRDAVKKPLWRTPLVADAIDRPPLPTFQFAPEVDGCGQPGHEEFMPLPDIDPLSPVDEAA